MGGSFGKTKSKKEKEEAPPKPTLWELLKDTKELSKFSQLLKLYPGFQEELSSGEYIFTVFAIPDRFLEDDLVNHLSDPANETELKEWVDAHISTSFLRFEAPPKDRSLNVTLHSKYGKVANGNIVRLGWAFRWIPQTRRRARDGTIVFNYKIVPKSPGPSMYEDKANMIVLADSISNNKLASNGVLHVISRPLPVTPSAEEESTAEF